MSIRFSWRKSFIALSCLAALSVPVTTSAHHILFKTPPNYNKLKIFGFLCFPWLKPYTNNKLEPRSEPCIFLGYSPTQSA